MVTDGPRTRFLVRASQRSEGGGGCHDRGGMLWAPAIGPQALAMLLTGPNMGGKSTLLRGTCVAALLAHCGCYGVHPGRRMGLGRPGLSKRTVERARRCRDGKCAEASMRGVDAWDY
eukprot:8766034-Pyramimonas_sp.AAC.1